MPELWAAKDAVNRKFKELWAAQNGTNRKLKEVWARDSGGVNRKIFSGQKIMVVQQKASWGSNGSGNIYNSVVSDSWAEESSYTEMQFDPGILIPVGQSIFDADITFEYSWHGSSKYGYVHFLLSVNGGSYETLYSRSEFTSQDPWVQHIVKSAASDIALTKLSFGIWTYLHGTGDSGYQSSMNANWASGGIRIAGKPITEIIILS